MHDTKQLTKAALLLTLALIFQSLRFIIPLPPFLSVFIIGALVNSVLAFAAWRSVLSYALGLSALLPCVAYMQGQLPIPALIPVVIVGNWVYILLLNKCKNEFVYLAPLAKAAVMYSAVLLVVQFFSLPIIFQQTIGFVMGIAQLITGVLGIILAKLTLKIIK